MNFIPPKSTEISFLLFLSLQNNILRLEQSPALSFSGRLLLVLSIIQHADIRPPSYESSTLPYLNDSLSAYKRGMTHLLDQVVKLVEICTSRFTVMCPYPVPPSCTAILRSHLAPPSCAAILRYHLVSPFCAAIFCRYLVLPSFAAIFSVLPCCAAILHRHIVSVDKQQIVAVWKFL